MYVEYFGLKEQPFSITPDPEFLFLGKNHTDALANLLYGIRSRQGFIEVTGAVGSGKTTLYRALLNRLGDEVVSALVVNPTLSPSQLLETIIEDFGINPRKRNRKGYNDALNQFLVDLSARGQTAVVVLDEAQDLKPSTLEQIRLLSNFETNKSKLLQVMMVGQPELRDLLSKPSMSQILQRITVSVHLSPLDRGETEQYIAHRIKVAGGEGMLIFDAEAVDGIFKYSQGVPRLINVLSHKALMHAYMAKTGQTIADYVAPQEKNQENV